MESFPVERHTPKGVWLRVWGHEKWVSATAKKRYAYPTQEEARESFIARKKRQILILSNQLIEAKKMLQMAETSTFNL
jgi:hypothetical protein